MRSLGLLSVAHAINHAQAVLLPLIFIKIIDEFTVGVDDIAFLVAFGAFAAGAVQLSYAYLTRVVSRRRLLGFGGILFGGGMAAQALATGFLSFAIPNIASRIGGSPQHPVGNGLLAEQFPTERRGFAISAHIAGGNVGTVVVALIGVPLIAAVGWRGASVVFGMPAIAVGIAILLFVRERGTDRAAALASGSVRAAFGRILRDRDLRWLYLTSALGGGGRGLGVVNLFALIYMIQVLGLDEETSGLMYGALIVFSVPMPLVAGWLSDRIGRKPLIIGVYLGGAVAFIVFLAAGTSLVWLWVGHRADGPVHVRREPAAPGAARRHRAAVDPRRLVRALLRDGVRGRVAVDGRLRRGHRRGRGGAGRADRVRADGGDVHPGRARDACRSGPSSALARTRSSRRPSNSRTERGERLAYCRAGSPRLASRARRDRMDARILLVEDDPSIREVTAIGLARRRVHRRDRERRRRRPRAVRHARRSTSCSSTSCCRASTGSRSAGRSAGPRRSRSSC